MYTNSIKMIDDFYYKTSEHTLTPTKMSKHIHTHLILISLGSKNVVIFSFLDIDKMLQIKSIQHNFACILCNLFEVRPYAISLIVFSVLLIELFFT